MKKFLSIVWYRVLPPEYGGQKGIAYFNEYLGRKVSLTCLCSENNSPDQPLSYQLVNKLPSSPLQFWMPPARKQVLQYIKENPFTHIIIEHPYHGWLGKYKEKYGFRFIVHAHNIEHLRMKARGKLWWRWIKRAERSAFRSADHILFKTGTDRSAAIELFGLEPRKCHLVPYGLSETARLPGDKNYKQMIQERHGISPDKKIILFAASPDHEPNRKARDLIVQQIIPLLEKKQFRFHFIICGGLPVKEIILLNRVQGLTAAGFVPSLNEYMQAADVFINPVVSGSGIQTKNMEAIAAGCNVVTTAFAATGLPSYLLHEKLFVSPDNDWDHLTDNIIRAATVRSTVPPQFYIDYDWSNIIAGLLQDLSSDD
ncbi:MAG: glycosyltransferase family 4 protein [Chitinophagaceae bacterium]|nr:glycosyltransferase family 4 protein [Chitinophagaceae bacterium]